MSFIPSRLTAQPFTLASLLIPARADAVSHGEARAGSQCRWRRTMSPATGIIERANQQARKTRLVKRTSRHRLCGPARNDDAVHWRTETNVCLRIARFHRPETSENVWRRCSAMRASRPGAPRRCRSVKRRNRSHVASCGAAAVNIPCLWLLPAC